MQMPHRSSALVILLLLSTLQASFTASAEPLCQAPSQFSALLRCVYQIETSGQYTNLVEPVAVCRQRSDTEPACWQLVCSHALVHSIARQLTPCPDGYETSNNDSSCPAKRLDLNRLLEDESVCHTRDACLELIDEAEQLSCSDYARERLPSLLSESSSVSCVAVAEGEPGGRPIPFPSDY